MHFRFNGFVLDTLNRCLLRGTKKIFLRPKTYVVLSHLVQHPHRLVTKDEIMTAAWPQANVVPAALRVSIQEIRRVLGDDAENPRFIETIGKSGYRFIAPVSLEISCANDGSLLPFVGRAAELEQLERQLELALAGQRQVVFVTGEPGIGKTTLIDVFTHTLIKTGEILVARGQCIEQYGTGEAFLPVLDALEKLCRAEENQRIIDILRRFAPSWVIDLPALISPHQRESLARQRTGIPPERRLREIAGFLEEVTKNRMVLLILEDLQWVDPSTLALISFLARRSEPARFMLIGTCRGGIHAPIQNIAAELALHKFCLHLPLKLLSRGAVEEYLTVRFNQPTISNPVISTVYKRSEGNPLFMVNVTDYLISHQAIVHENDMITLAPSNDESVPRSIRDLITRQFEALPDDDRELLETASVAGVTFPVLLVARQLGRAREAVEQRCRELTEREQFLQFSGFRRRPSGTASTLYGFTHALYHNVIYDRIGEAKRRRLHHSMGELLENVFQQAPEQVAAELALHFECAGNYERATRYISQATQKAIQQSAYQESITSGSRGLELLKRVPESPSKTLLELNLQSLVGTASASANGYSTQTAKKAFDNALALSKVLNNKPLLFHPIVGLWLYYLIRGELCICVDLAQQMLSIAKQTDNSLFLLIGHLATGVVNFYLGDFAAALRHLDESSSYALGNCHDESAPFGWDPGLVLACYKSLTLQFLGFPEKARQQARNAFCFSTELASPIYTASTAGLLARFYMYGADPDGALLQAESAIKLSTEYGFSHWLAVGMITKGWALVRKGQVHEGGAYLQEGVGKWRSMGAERSMPDHSVLLAECYWKAGQFDEAIRSIEDGLAIRKKTGDSVYAAELYRVKGEVLARKDRRNHWRANIPQAEECFRQAIHTARRQQAKSLELRATVSLCRLWQKIGKKKEAKPKLAKIYGWFTEGFDTSDLKEAKALLDELN